MTIRRVQYSIEYVHILTFREEYKRAIIPYFGFDNLRYAIDEEGTFNENIRLFFDADSLFISVRKDGLTFIYEGDVSKLNSSNGFIKTFWEIFDRVKSFEGYKKTVRNSLICHGVDIIDQEPFNVNEMFSDKWHSPFSDLSELAVIYEFEKEFNRIKLQYGNFSPKDIKIHDLMPFNNPFNSDLNDGFGVMARCEIKSDGDTASHSKLKGLLDETNGLLSKFNK